MAELGDLDDCYVTLANGKRAMVSLMSSEPMNGVTPCGPMPFNLCVGQGHVPGYWYMDKFGELPGIPANNTDIWEFGETRAGEYTYDANGTAPIVSLVSDNAADTEPIDVTGLDITGAEVVQSVTLTGTTRVALATPLWRVYRMENSNGTPLVGTVKCYVGTAATPADADVRAIMTPGNDQTLMALYTVPLGKVAFLLRGELGISRAGSQAREVKFAYKSRRVGSIFKIKKRVNCVSIGSSIYQDVRSIPDVVPALTDVKMTVAESSLTDGSIGAWGALDAYLVDEDRLTPEFLALIGQPTSIPT